MQTHEVRALDVGATATRRLPIATQTFLFTIGVCVLINHSSTARTGGSSLYGVNHGTLAILLAGDGRCHRALALVAEPAGCWRASEWAWVRPVR